MAITREEVLKMDLKSIYAAIKHPDTAADMQRLMGNRGSGVATHISELMLEAQNREAEVDAQLARAIPPSTEELAAEAAAMVAAPETPVVAEVVTPEIPPTTNPYEEEDAELKKGGITVIRDTKGKAVRFIEEYQVCEENGNPIGRPTHLESRTLAEHFAKQREVHTQATRAFHRLKKQKTTFKEQPKTILTPEEIQEAAKIALEEKDAGKVTDVIEQVIETKYKKREQELAEKEWTAQGKAISNEFMRRHLHDFNPCEANQKAMGEYFTENNLVFTLDNLETAFIDLMDEEKLVKVPSGTSQKQVTEVVNPAPVTAAATPAQPEIPAAETAATVTASETPAQPPVPSQPVVEATAPTPAAAPNVQPAARRPGVSSGIVPGTLSAQRPGAPDPVLARKEFLQTVKKMDPEVMKKKLKTDPQFVKQLESYGIRVR